MEKAGNLLQGILMRASKGASQPSTPADEARDRAAKFESAAPVTQPLEKADFKEQPRVFKTPYRRQERPINRPKSTPQAINSILKNVIKDKGLEDDIARYQFVLHWKDIVGHDLAAVTKPECLRRDVLVVRVESSVRAQEISFQKFEIMDRLQPFLSRGQTVKDIAFYVAG